MPVPRPTRVPGSMSSAAVVGGESLLVVDAHDPNAALSAITSRTRRLDASRRNGRVATQQRREGRSLVLAGDEPQQLVGPSEGAVGQRHPLLALVDTGDGDEAVAYLEDRVARYQRRRVAVRSESEVDEVETLRQ